jgi:glucosylceramidase
MANRRNFIKFSASALGAMAPGMSTLAGAMPEKATFRGDLGREPEPLELPKSEIAVWITDAKRKFAPGQPLAWQRGPATVSPDSVLLVQANKFQEILGFGGCFTDASCYVIDQLRPAAREQLLHELFHPSEMALNVNRTCVGSADSAASLYSYDDGAPDPEMKRFSIERDRKYILPTLRRVREINPEVYYFASPWSPPGWMKWNNSMLGGSMSRQYLAAYAQYFLKFIQGYAAEGVEIHAITVQNEIDTDQHGQMPACTWSQECETEFIVDHLGPLFEKTNTKTKIWILDHNFVLWGRVISELDNPDFRRYANSVAWHAYVGDASMMSKVHAAHPDADMHYTEGSTDYNDPHYMDDWTKWASTYTSVMSNWCSSAMAWNIATDEHGKPNIGPYPCGGILIINPTTQEVIRSGQYWAMSHFSRTLRRGARRFETQCLSTNLGHIAFQNPDGQRVIILTNSGAARKVQLNCGPDSATVPMEENSIATLVWK